MPAQFKFPANPALIYNASTTQSHADAQWYVAQHSLPSSYLAFNFGTGSGIWGGTSSDPYYNGTAGSISCQAAVHDGTDVFGSGGYSGLSVRAAWLRYATAYGIDCVLLSTFTPFTYVAAGAAYSSTLPGIMGNALSPSIAHGRLGCPATLSNYTFSWTSEQTPKTGTSLIQNAVSNAIASEASNNASLNHWCSSTAAYGNYVTASNNAAILAWLRTQKLNTVDLGGTGGDTNVNYTAWFSGTVSPAPGLFALCVGDSDFNTNASPGSHGYSNNYVAAQGAWGFTWDSFDSNFGFDLLYNGGSAALCTGGEPEASGLRDPFLVYQGLIANHACMASLLPWITYASVGTLSAASSYPDYTNPVAHPANLTAVGDPLYRPYRNTFTPASGAYFGLVAKLPFGLS